MTRRIIFAAVAVAVVCAPSLAASQVSTDLKRDSSWSGAAAAGRARAVADSLRGRILRLASFAGFAEAGCQSGELRTFERDTRHEAPKLLASLEQLILSYGAFASLNNPAGKALLSAVTRLEIGGPGPRWDTMTGTGPRSFNPMLPVNKTTTDCLLIAGTAPDGLVLPPVTNYTPPRDSGALNVPVEYGTGGLALLKSAYFKAHATDRNAVMHHSRVNAYALWDDYAIVSVLRQAERQGVVPMEKETTGAVYAFHRVGSEWRLIALVRSW